MKHGSVSSAFLALVAVGLTGCPCDKLPTPTICGTVDGSECRVESPDVWICPGEAVTLSWRADGPSDTTASITDLGTQKAVGQGKVTPSRSGEYRITSRCQIDGNDCSKSSAVYVHVVGETSDLTIPPVDGQWRLNMQKELVSGKILVAGIAPTCCVGCYMHKPPITGGYPYLKCDDKGTMCNELWSGTWLGDGAPMLTFKTGPTSTPIGRPLVGTWSFQPDKILNRSDVGNACFRLDLSCK